MDYLDILKNSGFGFSKKYGQNFITDLNLLRAMVNDADIDGDVVVEVGAGAGTLTACIAERAQKVVAFEIDTRLEKVLAQTVGHLDNASIVFADALKVDDGEILALTRNQPFSLVANLPYYITTPLLFRFLYFDSLRSLTVMVQKEVALRMCAECNTADYGALTAQLALMGQAKLTRNVSRAVFTPTPNVDSAIVRLDIRPKCEREKIAKVKKVIAAAFGMRRKTLANNLGSAYGISKQKAYEAIERLGMRADVRGETLDVNKFIELADILDGVV